MINIDQLRKIAPVIVGISFIFIITLISAFTYLQIQQTDFKQAYLYPEPSRDIADFTLSNHDQSRFQKKDLQDKWSFIFFGYTHCPDICPQTLQTMRLVAEIIDKENTGVDVQFIFISIDPQRDQYTPLKNYTHYFNSSFLGLSGTQQQLTNINQIFDASFDKIPNSENSEYYSMSHSPMIYITNPAKQRFAILPPPHNVENIVSDFRQMQSLFSLQI